jgi:hypothetical protein
MKFWVTKYDVASFAADTEGYKDMSVAAPSIVGDPFDDVALAQQKCDELSATECGDEVEFDMKNGKHYKGPRYIYRIGESDK